MAGIKQEEEKTLSIIWLDLGHFERRVRAILCPRELASIKEASIKKNSSVSGLRTSTSDVLSFYHETAPLYWKIKSELKTPKIKLRESN